MILDIMKFIAQEKAVWTELENLLDKIELEGETSLSLERSKRLCYLYERVSEDLAKVLTFSGERELRTRLENLVSRAYSNIYFQKKHKVAFRPVAWILVSFPASFRRNFKAFIFAFAVLLFGSLFGGISIMVDKDAKSAVFPEQFGHLMMSPDERVKKEEAASEPRLAGHYSSFAAQLMSNNIRVSILCLAFGVTWGIGTILMIFYNGVILGAVAFDFILSGHSAFMLGWLLPHGVVEIPACLIAGQAGLVLGAALLKPAGSRRAALRGKMDDIINLVGGSAMLLLWAGIIESFFSQIHEPFMPYWGKILFGIFELICLVVYLYCSGRKKEAAL